MIRRRMLRLFMPVGMALTFVAGSCTNDIGNLGLDILPSEDLFTGIDSAKYMSAQNFNPGFIKSNDAGLAVIGSINDLITGKTTASFITQVTLGQEVDTTFKRNDDFTVDSLVLSLAYSRNWWTGNKDARHNIKVYKFNGSLSLDNDYYSNMPVEGLYDPEPIGQRISSGWDQQADSVWNISNYVHKWNIKLDQATADEFFTFSQEVLESKEAFQAAFPGFFVEAEPMDTEGPNTGSLVNINLLSQSSDLRLYYHYFKRDDENVVTDTIQAGYVFPINRECVRINRFEHDHQSTIDFSSSQPDKLVAQGMAGSYVKFDLRKSHGGPLDFDLWKTRLDKDNPDDTYYGISAVDLYFKVDTILQGNDTTFYSPTPETLKIYTINDDGALEEPSYFTGNTTDPKRPWFIGGGYNRDTQEYQFRMNMSTVYNPQDSTFTYEEFFRMLVNGNSETQGPFVLASPNPRWDTRRVVLRNDQDTAEGEAAPRVQIKYVTFRKP